MVHLMVEQWNRSCGRVKHLREKQSNRDDRTADGGTVEQR